MSNISTTQQLEYTISLAYEVRIL